jgi:N-acyl homoserine lactone hydrolase
MKKYLLVCLVLFCAQATAGLKLYIFDCGLIRLDSLEMFNLQENESDVSELFVPCYLIEHPQGSLLFDGGLPKGVAESNEPVAIDGGSMEYTRWIADQLSDMGIEAKDVSHVAYSHLHFDHAGAANTFVDSNIIMQRAEWDAAFAKGGEFVDTALIEDLKGADVTFVEGDHDVFGDGSVKLIFTPGHTPGHQVLLVNLADTGPLVLSGDLYHTRANRSLRRAPVFNTDPEQTMHSMDKLEKLLQETGATLWIEHDKRLADTLRKAPLYYD